VAEAVRAYAEALNQQNRERRAQAEFDRNALDKVERGIAGTWLPLRTACISQR
jgi:site-specific DNA recombinase